jgi:DNA primase
MAAFHDATDGKTLVREAVDLVKLVGESVPLKRAGRRFAGLCPFHSEKSPSFSVDPERGVFYCFGCKKGGDCFSFVMERDRVDFVTALRTLAEWAGVQLPERTGRDREKTDRLDRLRACLSTAAGAYRKYLQSDAGKPAREYLQGRGFDEATLERFGIGLAPDGWDGLARLGVAAKFDDGLLLDAGLIKEGDRGGLYDVFRNRVIFPIRDEQGRPIAFGGRVLPGDDSPAKYLNSPETPLFHKSRVLFGLDVAKKAVVASRTAIVFEGYADAAMAHQHGIGEAVAVLGTSLTAEHAAVLRRLADKVVLLFDADAAGGMATRRSVELFLQEPIEVVVAELPTGQDPDEFLQSKGVDAFRALVADGRDALTHAWRAMVQGAGAGVTQQQRAVDEYLRLLREARSGGAVDSVRLSAVLSRVAKLTGLSDAEVRRKTSPGAGRRADRPVAGGAGGAGALVGRPERAMPSGSARMEGELLGAMFCRPALWESVQVDVQPGDFSDARMRWLAERFWERLREEGEPTFGEWLEAVSEATRTAGGDEEQAGRARGLCVELQRACDDLGDPAATAESAVNAFLRRREQAVTDELRATLRRSEGSDESKLPASGDAGPTTQDGQAQDEQARTLRQLQARIARQRG